MTCGVIVPAAGAGTRMRAPVPKQFLKLGAKEILARTLGHFQSAPEIGRIVVAVPAGHTADVIGMVRRYRMTKVTDVISGGRRRQDSVRNGLDVFGSEPPDAVLVHDGVRPFITHDLLKRLLLALSTSGAAMAAVLAKETVKLVDRLVVQSTPDRAKVWIAQTPQAFRYATLRRAYDAAAEDRFRGTDDASLVERIGVRVKIVQGSYENIKITTAEDFELAKIIAKKFLW